MSNNNRSSFLGVIFGMIAGAAWGLAFLIPNVCAKICSFSSFAYIGFATGYYFQAYGVVVYSCFFQ